MPPVAVAAAAGCHVSRINGDELLYNQKDPYLPDLLVCRPELAEATPQQPGDLRHPSEMLRRKLAAEAIGTAFLLIGVVGSGIMAERLSPTDVGLQLFQNAAATAGVLLVIIVMFGPLSGAHFNPVVTLADWALGGLSPSSRRRLYQRPDHRRGGRHRTREPDVRPWTP